MYSIQLWVAVKHVFITKSYRQRCNWLLKNKSEFKSYAKKCIMSLILVKVRIWGKVTPTKKNKGTKEITRGAWRQLP